MTHNTMRHQTEGSLVIDADSKKIIMTRVFDAPRELVYRVSTEAEFIPQWWGPRNLTTTVDALDLRPGGRWRYVQRDADGNEYAFRGEYQEITPPERLVFTFEYEGMPGHILLETVTLEDLGNGQTRVTTTDHFKTVEDLEGMVASGMESGAVETMERLGELLSALQSER